VEELVQSTPAAGLPAARSLADAIPSLVAADVVVPVLHGRFGEDGTLQSLLEMLGVCYVGNGVLTSAVGMDKNTTKQLMASAGLPVARSVVLSEPGRTLSVPEREELGLPVFVKPARAGSSVGVSRVEHWDQLDSALATAWAEDTKVLVEEAVLGREVEMGVLEYADGKLMVGPPLEIKFTTDRTFFDFDAKYKDVETRFEVPAMLLPQTTSKLREMTMAAFEALGCRGLVRVDFLLRDGTEPVVNEVNTFPGFTPFSQYPKIWEAAGLPRGDLMDVLIDTALTRARSSARATEVRVGQ
jgi:D-alanine-D-alanine ligase